jgi:hypothetical protein
VQERVYRRLLLIGPGPAAFFGDACRIVNGYSVGVSLETSTHLVGHLLRDLESAVRLVLYTQLVSRPQMVTGKPSAAIDLPAIGDVGDRHASTSAGELPAGEEPEGDSENQPREVLAILAALEFPPDGAEVRQWLSLAGRRKETALHKIAHRDALNAPRPLNAEFVSNFKRVTQLLDQVLERFEARYANVYEALDELLAIPNPSAADLKRLQGKIPNTPRTLGYFFERLQHAGWLRPLKKKGFFQSAPLPESDEQRKAIGFPGWPVADYLARVAVLEPAEVSEIVEDVPATENVRVQTQLIEIMLKLRPQDRTRLLPRVLPWIPALSQYYLGDQLTQLASAFVRDGSLDAALCLTGHLFELPKSDSTGVRLPAQLVEYRRDRERTWHLRSAATGLVPALLHADGMRTIELLSDALDYHVGRRPEDLEADPTIAQGLSDLSVLWADDLGQREGINSSELRLYLTHVLLQSARKLGEQKPQDLMKMLEVLRQRGPRVFRRIELATLAVLVGSDNPDVSSAAIAPALDRLTTRAIVIQDGLSAEYGTLLQATFPRLTKPEQSRVLETLQPPDFSQ